MKEQEDVSLANLASGGAVERFDDELKRVLANIKDPNTTLEARTITLKVSIKPDKDRDFSVNKITISSKVAPPAPIETKMFIAETPKGTVATEYNPKQPELDLSTAGKVTQLRTA